jgi:hypothetical protein
MVPLIPRRICAGATDFLHVFVKTSFRSQNAKGRRTGKSPAAWKVKLSLYLEVRLQAKS